MSAALDIMCTQSTSGADSDMNSTGLDDLNHGDILDSTVQIDRGMRTYRRYE